MTQRYGNCRYPMWGDEEKPTHVYCNMKTAPGFPYCDIHAQKAYPRIAAQAEHEKSKEQTK